MEGEMENLDKIWQMIVPILNAVGALAYRMTGDTMVLRHRDFDGNIIYSAPNLSALTWVNQEES